MTHVRTALALLTFVSVTTGSSGSALAAPGSAPAHDVVALASPATAYASRVTMRQETGEGSVRARVGLPAMRAGQSRELRAAVVVGGPRQRQVAFGLKITCAAAGGRTSTQVWGGTNRMKGQADAPVRLRMMFVAPSGGDFTCALRAYVTSHVGFPGASLPLRRGSLAAGPLIATPGAGRQFTLRTATNPYVALRHSLTLPLGQVPAQAGRVQVVADVYLTECHIVDGFCASRAYPKAGVARVRSQLVATPSNHACAVARSRMLLSPITSLVHHLRAGHMLVLPPATRCGTWTLTFVAADAHGTTPFVISSRNPYSYAYAVPLAAS